MGASILEQEIRQQPQVIQSLLDVETTHVQQMANNLRGKFQYVMIAARGTSDNAARYAQYLFGAHNRIPVALATPSLFSIYENPPSLQGSLVIGISQSGQSPDIVSVIAEGKRQGRPTLAITNDPESPLATSAEYVIPLHAGTERAVAASKTYTASLVALALFSALLEDHPQHLSELHQIPGLIQSTLNGLESSLHRVERYRFMNRCAVIGRGFNYATAFEVALKVKELTRVVAEPYSSADFRHGPIALVHGGFPVIYIAPKSRVSSDLSDLIRSINRLNSEILVISNDQALLDFAHLALPLPDNLPEWISPMIAIIPGQMFSLYLTIEKGMDPDKPIGLTKVTETL
jgi:glutamine---fructose-6-phosphate transaminase (isomerizing)